MNKQEERNKMRHAKCIKRNCKNVDCVLFHDTKGKIPMIDCYRCIKERLEWLLEWLEDTREP